MKRRDDPNQLQIDWTSPSPLAQGGDAPDRKAGACNSDVHERPSGPPVGHPSPPPVELPPPVQRLPWDFSTTFPQPTDEAIDAGIIAESDLEPANLKAMHEQHAGEALATLRHLDRVTDARRRNVDPGTGKPPRTHAAREKLRRHFEQEPARLERHFQTLMDVYENSFGHEAADAFAKAIRARHAGIEVTAYPEPPEKAPRAILPAPKPLPSRVAAAVFGLDDAGDPVHPSAEEVQAITEQHAEKLAGLFQGLETVGRSLKLPCTDKGRLYRERDRLLGKVREAVATYAEDFGQEAAGRLEAYARRAARSGERVR